jgi:hypothetical protein
MRHFRPLFNTGDSAPSSAAQMETGAMSMKISKPEMIQLTEFRNMIALLNKLGVLW